MMGMPGTGLDPETLSLIREYGVSNFILFARNAKKGPDQLKGLCQDLKNVCADMGLPPPVIAVDQEGGPVQRLGPPFWPRIPSNRETALSTEPEAWAFSQAETAAEILASLGIGLNLAPVLDLVPSGAKGVLQDRSYGFDPQDVSILGKKYIRTLETNGVGATAKHFPGLGRVKKDPHYERPVVTVPKETLLDEMSPFRVAVKADVKAVMTSHVVYLEMGGITNHCSMGEAAVKAVLAGHDLLLVCHKAQRVKETIHALDRAWSQGILNTRMLDRSLTRIARLGPE